MNKDNQKYIRLGKNLATLIVLTTIAIFFYVYKPNKLENLNSTSNDSELNDSLISKKNEQSIIKKAINPNTASFDELVQIGLTKKQANNCIKYREKGGKFFNKEDLKKLYTITETDYLNVEKFIYIPSKKQTDVKTEKTNYNKSQKEEKTTTRNIEKINLNTCDTTILKTFQGIGSFRAKKIIEYREKLGGFYSISQLKNVYSMDSTIINKIEKYLIIDTSQIIKININTITFKELCHHPLINYDLTKNILNYRKIVGTIKIVEELRENNIITKEELDILQFYLKTF